jgi:hypothetical protein
MKYRKSDAWAVDTTYDFVNNGFVKCSNKDPSKAPPGCIVTYEGLAKVGSTKNNALPIQRAKGLLLQNPDGRTIKDTDQKGDKLTKPLVLKANFPARNGKDKDIDRSGYELYFGHIEIATDDDDYPAVSDFKQTSPIIHAKNPEDQNLEAGWGFNASKTREYSVIGIFCRGDKK